jgi:hypothetical protein
MEVECVLVYGDRGRGVEVAIGVRRYVWGKGEVFLVLLSLLLE